jgi:hypothetical protein
MTSDLVGTPKPAPWAVAAAYAVPLCVLPSTVWRCSLVVDGTVGLDAEGWYLLALSIASAGLALLTLGLVRPWGERIPRWVPVLSGRPIPMRVVVVPALIGASLLIASSLYVVVDELFHVVGQGPVAIGPSGQQAAPRPEPDGVLALYVPLLAWGPLLLAVTLDHRRRRTSARTPAGGTSTVRSRHDHGASGGDSRAA